MLRLSAPTEPGWAEAALSDPDSLLLDHAHCELKAASTATGLVFRYPQHAFLAEPLSRFAREELAHFEVVLRALAARGRSFAPQPASPYARRLRAAGREREPGKLVDALLASALIEARSCERLGLLAQAAREESLAELWSGLLAAEARHHGLFLELAGRLAPPHELRARLGVLARAEATLLAEPAARSRLFSGGVAAPTRSS